MWILLALLAGIWIGLQLSKLFHKEMIKNILEESGVTRQELHKVNNHTRELMQQQNPQEVNINVEQHSGHYYAFRKENDEFLGQGEDYIHLLTALQQKLGSNTVVNLDYEVAKTMKGYPEAK